MSSKFAYSAVFSLKIGLEGYYVRFTQFQHGILRRFTGSHSTVFSYIQDILELSIELKFWRTSKSERFLEKKASYCAVSTQDKSCHETEQIIIN